MGVAEWLDDRSPLKKALDDIRSRGHYEHKEILRERTYETPLRIEYRCDGWPDVTDEHVALIRSTDELLGLNLPPAERPDKVNLKHWVDIARSNITVATEFLDGREPSTHQTSERSASRPVGHVAFSPEKAGENRERDAMSDVIVRRGTLSRAVLSEGDGL